MEKDPQEMARQNAETQRALDALMPRPENAAQAAQSYRIVELLEAILAEQVKQRELLEEIATRIGR